MTGFNGRDYRTRPLKEVVDELESLSPRVVFFFDDNIAGYNGSEESRASELFEKIAQRGLHFYWAAQSSINFADNLKLMKNAQKVGPGGLFVGIESLNRNRLIAMGKGINSRGSGEEDLTSHFKDKIRKLHDHQIGIVAGFIFGNDYDTGDIFKKTVDFVFDAHVDGTQYTLLTPLPGTRLYDRMALEGRLVKTDYPKDWALYDMFHIVYEPKGLGSEELREGLRFVYKETNSFIPSVKRAFCSSMDTRSMSGIFPYLWNRGLYKQAASLLGTKKA